MGQKLSSGFRAGVWVKEDKLLELEGLTQVGKMHKSKIGGEGGKWLIELCIQFRKGAISKVDSLPLRHCCQID